MHLVKGRTFGLGLCAIALVLACGSKERSFGGQNDAGNTDGEGGSSPATDDTTTPQTDTSDTDSTKPGASDSDSTDAESSDSSAQSSSTATSSDGGLNDGGDVSSPEAGSDAGDAGDAGDGGTTSEGCVTTDPNCECVEGVLQGKDQDGDTHLSKACEAAPGDDCDDLDGAFVTNVCGGCAKDLVGNPGDACLDCGILACSTPDVLGCVDPTPAPRRCASTLQTEVCYNGQWVSDATCSDGTQICSSGLCYSYSSTAISSEVVSSTAYAPEVIPDRCNTPETRCVFGFFHPRDASFELSAPPQISPRNSSGSPTDAVLNSLTGLDLG